MQRSETLQGALVYRTNDESGCLGVLEPSHCTHHLQRLGRSGLQLQGVEAVSGKAIAEEKRVEKSGSYRF